MGEIDNLEINVTEKDKKAEQKDEKMLDELKIDEKVSSTTKTE